MLLGASACGDQFVTVTNPNVIDASTVDPVSSGGTLALSAMQNLATSMGWMAAYGSWLTEETNVGDTFRTRNEFGFRQISRGRHPAHRTSRRRQHLGASWAERRIEKRLR